MIVCWFNTVTSLKCEIHWYFACCSFDSILWCLSHQLYKKFKCHNASHSRSAHKQPYIASKCQQNQLKMCIKQCVEKFSILSLFSMFYWSSHWLVTNISFDIILSFYSHNVLIRVYCSAASNSQLWCKKVKKQHNIYSKSNFKFHCSIELITILFFNF